MAGIELVGGSNNLEGRVEIVNYDERFTLCDDGFDDIDATVICRQLGFTSGEVSHPLLYLLAFS